MGDSGTIVGTGNGGSSWSAQGGATTRNLLGVTCISAGACYAGGDGGAILALNAGAATVISSTNAAYNALDWQTQFTEQVGTATPVTDTYQYDPMGRLRGLSVTGLPSSLTYGLDAAGRVVQIGDVPTGAPSPTATAIFNYDGDNRLIGESLPGAVTATAVVDGPGRLIHLMMAGRRAEQPLRLYLRRAGPHHGRDRHYQRVGHDDQRRGTGCVGPLDRSDRERNGLALEL